MLIEEYKRARKLAQKQYRKAVAQGVSPYLPALDEILQGVSTAGEMELGTVEIPLELTVGTKEAGRKTAFSQDFLPLLDENSEFAGKWMRLYASQVEEGIRDAVTAYEYRNRFYIQEGNKRVSIMKYLKVPTIRAKVTRIIPIQDDTKECKIYYEFMEFYNLTGLNRILFSEPGGYGKLLKAVGKDWETEWTGEEIKRLENVFYHFSVMYRSISGGQPPEMVGEAFLRCLDIFPYEEMGEKSPVEIGREIKSIKKEIGPEALSSGVEHVMEPDKNKQSIVTKILPASKKMLHAAFIYDAPVGDSGWIYAHELGRLHVEEVYKERLIAAVYEKTNPQYQIEDIIEQAVADGNTVVFTVTPNQMKAAMKAAIRHTEVSFFNCSLNFPYKSVRTYYPRMYEVKFLIGLIAGVMSHEDVIGYEADYPIYGAAANINAFARGVAMVRPGTKVQLYWPCVKEEFQENRSGHITVVSAKEMISPKGDEKPYGLYRQYGDGIMRLATSVLDWGKFYERMIGFILDGTWKKAPAREKRTLNYWWGLSADVMELVCSEKIPEDVKELVEKFRQMIAWGVFHPFEGVIFDQDGQAHGAKDSVLDTEEIITMDWLCSNVVGSIPGKEMLTEKALELVQLQGLGGDS